MRMFREVVFFESLFRSNKWTWIFGYLFHFGMLLVLLRHLRYFTEPVWFWVNWVQPFGKYAAFAMLAGLLGLVGTSFSGRPGALYIHPVRSPDAGPAGRHRHERPGYGVPCPHRHRRA